MQTIAALEKKVALLKEKADKRKQIDEHRAAIRKLSGPRKARKAKKS